MLDIEDVVVVEHGADRGVGELRFVVEGHVDAAWVLVGGRPNLVDVMLGLKDSVVVEHGVDQIFHSPNLSWNGGRATGRWTDGVDHDPPAPRTGHILAEPSVADKLLEQQARLQSPIHVHDLLERIHVIGCRGITTGRERHACWPWTFVDCRVECF